MMPIYYYLVFIINFTQNTKEYRVIVIKIKNR